MTETQPQWEWMEVAAGGFYLHRLFKGGRYMATAVSHESKIPELAEHLNAQDKAVATLKAALEEIRDKDLEVIFMIVDPESDGHVLAQKNARFGFRAAQQIARAALEATK